MSPFEPPADPPRRGARGHVEALRESLDLVAGRLREGVADAVTRGAAGAVRQAVLALLAGGHARPVAPPVSPVRAAVRYPVSRWDRDEDEEHLDDRSPFRPPWDDPDPDPESEWEPEPAPASSGPRPVPRWLPALSAGWQAGRWHLRVRRARYPLLAALGVGLAVCLAALLGGSLLPGGAGLLDSVLNLTALAGVARAGSVVLGA